MFRLINKNQFDPLGQNSRPKWQLFLGGVIMLTIVIVVLAGGYFQIGSNNVDHVDGDISLEDTIDTDGDGLFNFEEKIYGTDINNKDTDNDGYSDFEEIKKGYNPLGEGKLALKDVEGKKTMIDNKKKEILDNSFVKKAGSDGGFKTPVERYGDEDNDGLSNIIEMAYGTDPRNSDTDKDGRSDKEEIKDYQNPLGSGIILEDIVGIIVSAEEFMAFHDMCKKVEGDALRDLCYTSSAVLTNKDSYCEKTKGGEFDGRSDCYTDLAIVNLDEKYCSNISAPKIRSLSSAENRYSCFQKIAKIKQDTNICRNIPYYVEEDRMLEVYPRYECYAAVALQTGDKKICDGMLDLIEKDKVSFYLNAGIYSNRIPVNRVDHSTGEPNQLILEELQTEDYWWCLVNVAGYHGDMNICSAFKDEDLKQDCLFAVSENTDNVKVCDLLTFQPRKESCYRNVAIKSNNIDLCKKINSGWNKKECIKKVAIQNKDVNTCELLSDQKVMDDCIFEIAKKIKTLDSCKDITTGYIHDRCIDYMPKNVQNSDYCEFYKTESKKNSCYKNFSK